MSPGMGAWSCVCPAVIACFAVDIEWRTEPVNDMQADELSLLLPMIIIMPSVCLGAMSACLHDAYECECCCFCLSIFLVGFSRSGTQGVASENI